MEVDHRRTFLTAPWPSGVRIRGDGDGVPHEAPNKICYLAPPVLPGFENAISILGFDITLCDRHLTVILNGTKIIDNQPVLGVTGGALTADEDSPGPIYLQGDHGKVMYRNLVLTPIME